MGFACSTVFEILMKSRCLFWEVESHITLFYNIYFLEPCSDVAFQKKNGNVEKLK